MIRNNEYGKKTIIIITIIVIIVIGPFNGVIK